MQIGDKQRLIIDKSREKGGVSFDFVKELYGNLSQAKATITKLVANEFIEAIPGTLYPIKYRFKNVNTQN